MDELVKRIIKHEPDTEQYVLKDALEGLPKLYPKTEKNKGGLENEKIGYKFREGIEYENNFLRFIGGSSKYLTNHTNRFNNERDVEIFSRLPEGANSLHPSIADIMPYSSRNHIFKDKYFKLNESEVSKTITSHMKFDCNMYIHPTQPRGLSPREAARIQTFPDDYVFMGANNIWYAQIGNAVPVKLAQAIGEEIMKCLN
jgi:DNA (cytosine-5)-methyltransferase 1